MAFRVPRLPVFFCALMLCWSVAYSMPTASELVRDSLQAPYLWDFSGTQVIVNWNSQGSSTSTSVKIIHRKPNVFLVAYQNGSRRVVLDDGKYLRQYEPSLRALLVERRPPTQTSSSLFRLLSHSHRMVLCGTDTICGRKTYVVEIIPRVPGNPWRKCWIDYYTKYTLKNEQYGPNWPKGKPQSFMFWSSISFKPISSSKTKLTVPAGTRTVVRPEGHLVLSLDQMQRMLGFRVLMPKNPPLGYAYDGANVVRMGGSGAAHLRFTNGLNAISVFQSTGSIRESDLTRNGAQVLVWRQGSINIALVGNIDKTQLVALQRQISSGAERDTLSLVAERTGATQYTVRRLRDYGFGFKDITIALLAQKSCGQDPYMLLRLHSVGFTWEEIAQRYSFSLREIRLKLQGIRD